MFSQLTIIAPGLLGASVAMAAKERGIVKTVSVYARRDAAVAALGNVDWCDSASTSLADACQGSDLIILCAPVERIISLAQDLSQLPLTAHPIVTDVGSVKADIVHYCETTLSSQAHFVGSHPMAGSEKTGMENACANLFQNRPCFVTPSESTDSDAAEKVSQFWQALGSTVIVKTPADHDENVAKISHLPHVLAAALASFLGQNSTCASKTCGNGLKDSTRIAAGDPTLWREIISQNRQEILRSLTQFQDHLQHFNSAIANENDLEVLKFLSDGKQFRDQL